MDIAQHLRLHLGQWFSKCLIRVPPLSGSLYNFGKDGEEASMYMERGPRRASRGSASPSSCGQKTTIYHIVGERVRNAVTDVRWKLPRKISGIPHIYAEGVRLAALRAARHDTWGCLGDEVSPSQSNGASINHLGVFCFNIFPPCGISWVFWEPPPLYIDMVYWCPMCILTPSWHIPEPSPPSLYLYVRMI